MSAMNAEFFDAIEQIEKEKGMPRGYMQEKIQQALLTAFKRDNPDCEDNVEGIMDENKKTISMFVLKTIVEESEYVNDATQILLDEARHYDKKAGIGDTVRIPVETKKFGRIAAQAAKQVIIQGIREAERGIIYDEFTSKEHEILTGVVTRIDPRTGAVSIKISSNSEFTEAMLSATERIKGEELTEGDRIKVYVVEVRKSTRGPQVLISRTHPGLVKRLFELEVPEIFDGTVEIRSIAREAGSRTKMAVYSADPEIDPIGACVGPRGGRVASIVNELGGEKIDIIKYSEDPEQYIASALSPASPPRAQPSSHRAARHQGERLQVSAQRPRSPGRASPARRPERTCLRPGPRRGSSRASSSMSRGRGVRRPWISAPIRARRAARRRRVSSSRRCPARVRSQTPPAAASTSAAPRAFTAPAPPSDRSAPHSGSQ